MAPVLLSGEWIDIGYDSAIRYDEGKILHRFNGQVKKRKLSWLLEEVPLLNWILQNSQKKC
jgi:hypothetical protein